MQFRTRKLIKPDNLNNNNTLFGGTLLRWIDEEASIYAMTQLHSRSIVTKFMSEINFIASAKQGDIVEIGLAFVAIGTTSITINCEVRNVFTKKSIIKIDKIVFVKVDDNEKSVPHGITLENIRAQNTL